MQLILRAMWYMIFIERFPWWPTTVAIIAPALADLFFQDTIITHKNGKRGLDSNEVFVKCINAIIHYLHFMKAWPLFIFYLH